MEFGKHIGKGIWGFADKGLPAIYGVAFMFIVVRHLPAEEYGAFLLFQSVFLLVTALGYSFTIQPMLKYVAEGLDVKNISSAAFLLLVILISFVVCMILIFIKPLAMLLDAQHSEKVRSLFWYLPIVFAATIYRLIAAGLLQARFEIKKLFYVDAWYYGLSLLIILAAKYFGLLTSAEIVVQTLIVASLFASIVSYFLSRHIAVPSVRWEPESAKKILSYGKFGLLNNVGYLVQTQFDTFILSYFGGVAGVAAYGAAKIFTRVFDMYAQVIQTLVIPASSMLKGRNEEGKLSSLVEKSICFSFYAIIPVMIIFAIFPKQLFSIIYGGRYTESIPILRILTITALFVPWTNVISSVLYGIGKVRTGSILSLIMLFLSFGAYIGLGSMMGMQGIIWGVVCVQLVMTMIGIFLLKQTTPFTIISTLRRTKDIVDFVKRKGWFRRSSSGV
jgi:O-antigen/teichoic acid export membrane protein